MLVQFTVKNFKSFKNETTLSLVASSTKEHKNKNTFQASRNISLLKSATIYGPNASGKSNFFQAMCFMKNFIVNSSKETQSTEAIPVERFLLNTENAKNPSCFEITFIHKNTQYRYGFSVTEKEVSEEWLYYVPNVQELEVFVRKGQEFKLSRHFKSEQPLIDANRIRPNALLLSVSAQFNGEIAKNIMEWFSSFNCISGINSQKYGSITCHLSNTENGKNIVLNFLKKADLGIDDFKIVEKEISPNNLPAAISEQMGGKNEKVIINEVKTSHKQYDSKGKIVGTIDFDLNNESRGTQKFFELCGPIIDTLGDGKVLIVDELDSRLHPKLIKAICQLFNSSQMNRNNAQLVFVSHNTNVLDKDLFRRDQIWFTEKDQYGASELFSLVEFKDPKNGKKVRNDASYEKSYLSGIYGSVPHVRDFEVNYGN
ncbi:MAG: AAA family ATPase [Candidatus Omnitrophica bacterium]|nr:AAA family ATPase [Candidatus Omnitrophota bacterium]